jgi:uncharacterized Zn-finger protein
LQSLSLQAPDDTPNTVHQPYGGIPISASEKPPSWMLPNDRPPASYSQTRKSNFIGHSRSVSEFTLPPLSLSPHRPTPARTHRRAVSANTVDFMLSPSPNPSMRAQSYSPQETPLHTTATSNPNLFEQLITNETTTNTTAATADASGRYVCPYCHKKFSRPSSLRIHTYSHTGEKPFVCTEPGCGRHFSVQSNMRRHLRVHRLGRSVNTNNHTLGTTNEENETA